MRNTHTNKPTTGTCQLWQALALSALAALMLVGTLVFNFKIEKLTK